MMLDKPTKADMKEPRVTKTTSEGHLQVLPPTTKTTPQMVSKVSTKERYQGHYSRLNHMVIPSYQGHYSRLNHMVIPNYHLACNYHLARKNNLFEHQQRTGIHQGKCSIRDNSSFITATMIQSIKQHPLTLLGIIRQIKGCGTLQCYHHTTVSANCQVHHFATHYGRSSNAPLSVQDNDKTLIVDIFSRCWYRWHGSRSCEQHRRFEEYATHYGRSSKAPLSLKGNDKIWMVLYHVNSLFVDHYGHGNFIHLNSETSAKSIIAKQQTLKVVNYFTTNSMSPSSTRKNVACLCSKSWLTNGPNWTLQVVNYFTILPTQGPSNSNVRPNWTLQVVNYFTILTTQGPSNSNVRTTLRCIFSPIEDPSNSNVHPTLRCILSPIEGPSNSNVPPKLTCFLSPIEAPLICKLKCFLPKVDSQSISLTHPSTQSCSRSNNRLKTMPMERIEQPTRGMQLPMPQGSCAGSCVHDKCPRIALLLVTPDPHNNPPWDVKVLLPRVMPDIPEGKGGSQSANIRVSQGNCLQDNVMHIMDKAEQQLISAVDTYVTPHGIKHHPYVLWFEVNSMALEITATPDPGNIQHQGKMKEPDVPPFLNAKTNEVQLYKGQNPWLINYRAQLSVVDLHQIHCQTTPKFSPSAMDTIAQTIGDTFHNKIWAMVLSVLPMALSLAQVNVQWYLATSKLSTIAPVSMDMLLSALYTCIQSSRGTCRANLPTYIDSYQSKTLQDIHANSRKGVDLGLLLGKHA